MGGALLDEAYNACMERSIIQIQKDGSGKMKIGIDGATNVLYKSFSNVIVDTPLTFFIEYLRSDLNRETTRHVVDRLKDVVQRLDAKLGIQCSTSFISDSCKMGCAMLVVCW